MDYDIVAHLQLFYPSVISSRFSLPGSSKPPMVYHNHFINFKIPGLKTSHLSTNHITTNSSYSVHALQSPDYLGDGMCSNRGCWLGISVFGGCPSAGEIALSYNQSRTVCLGCLACKKLFPLPKYA